MAEQRWSITRRLMLLYASGLLLVVVPIGLGGSWSLRQSIDRELDALLIEELHEVAAIFPHGERTPIAFAGIVAEFSREHPSNPMAWRVWSPEGEGVWGEFGAVDMLTADVPARAPLKRSQRLENNNQRWRTEDLPTGHRVGFLLDGSEQLAMLRRFELFTGLGLLVGVALALVTGRVFAGRIGRLLRRVAERTRQVRDPDEVESLELRNPPDEIREVVEALHDLLRGIRAETEQARIFTAGLAHEMRSPIQNLVGETEVALLGERTPEEYRRVLRSHLQEMRDLGDAVDNLVSICSPGAGRRAAAVEDFDLAQEASLRLERERSHAEQRGVDLQVESGGPTRIHGDREALLRAVRNLTDNAIEWSPAGESVQVHILGEDGHVRVTVDDAGPGVPEELRERIFTPFFRGPGSRGRRVGYGLGLAITRMAVEAGGGTIEVGSSPYGGARFEVVLPREVGNDASAGSGRGAA